MRFFAALPILAALFSGATAKALASRTDVCLTEIPCDGSLDKRAPMTPAPNYKRLTNGERLARGLKLNPPTSRKRSGTHAARSVPSSSPSVTVHGKLEVIRSSDSLSLGFVSVHIIGSNQYRYQSEDNAAIFSLDIPAGATSVAQADLTPVNSDVSSPPYFGFVQGRDDTDSDLSSGSFQYLYLTNTNPTSPGSTAQNVGNAYTSASGTSRTSESAVWSINIATGAVAPQWINTDGSAPAIQLFSQGTALYAGGSSSAFASRYPSPVTLYTLKWVPV